MKERKTGQRVEGKDTGRTKEDINKGKGKCLSEEVCCQAVVQTIERQERSNEEALGNATLSSLKDLIFSEIFRTLEGGSVYGKN